MEEGDGEVRYWTQQLLTCLDFFFIQLSAVAVPWYFDIYHGTGCFRITLFYSVQCTRLYYVKNVGYAFGLFVSDSVILSRFVS